MNCEQPSRSLTSNLEDIVLRRAVNKVCSVPFLRDALEEAVRKHNESDCKESNNVVIDGTLMTASSAKIEDAVKLKELEEAYASLSQLHENSVSALKTVVSERDQLKSANEKLDKLYSDLVTVHTKKITEIEELEKSLNESKSRHLFAAVIGLLKITENHFCYVHGRYVRDMIIPAMSRDFVKCKPCSIHLVFKNVQNLNNFLAETSACLVEYREKPTILGANTKKYHLVDSLGDFVGKVRLYVEQYHYGWESYTEEAYYVPSSNEIVVPHQSVSEFFSDCKQNVYRLSPLGFEKLFSKDNEDVYLKRKITKLIKENMEIVSGDGKSILTKSDRAKFIKSYWVEK